MEQDMDHLTLAQLYARTLVIRARPNSGTNDNAIRSVGEKTGLGYWTIWGLFHRRRKSAGGKTVDRLRCAMIRHLEMEVGHLEQELFLLRAAGVDTRDDEIASVAADLAKARKTLRAGTVERGGGG